MGKPTLQSLADELNVSRQTVSNVINAPSLVKPETRERVRAAIEASGYRPSVAARALRKQRSMQIGFRLREAGDGINGAVMDRFLHSLVEEAAEHGYRLSLFTAKDHEDEIAQLCALADSKAIDGCILTDTIAADPRPSALLAARIPIVAFGRPWGSKDSLHSWVDVDGKAGTLGATRHLRGAGRSKIGYIGWPDAAGIGVERRAGWVEGCGLAQGENERLERRCPDTAADGASNARSLIESGVDSIVCASDSLALGALTEINAANLDIDVIGFDDTPVARAIGLSSVEQPMRQAADRVCSTLVKHIEDATAPATQALLSPQLRIRRPADFIGVFS